MTPLIALALLACKTTTSDVPWQPDISAADFDGSVIDNPFFPLPVGATWTYEGQIDGGLEEIVVEVLSETKEVWGVTATVVRDTVTVDGELAEDTWDWYAQDVEGNVWYLGEDTCEYEGGECVNTHGAWEAGVDGAVLGIMMLADPQVGDAYYQEYLAGEAEDEGEVVAVDAAVDVPAGSWTGCVKTRDFSAIDDAWAYKYYCRGVGTVLEEEEGELRVELTEFSGL